METYSNSSQYLAETILAEQNFKCKP